jgi:GTPase SAR1 family protein
MSKKRTILLYGRTRSGKSTQIGELAEHVYKTTKKITRLYTADRGSYDPIRIYVELGIIEVIEIGDTDPWLFLNKAVRGFVRDDKGKWVQGTNTNVGVFAFESMTSFADELMANMAKKAGEGVNIGGGANIAFQVGGDGESLKVSGHNMAMYGVCQSRITEEVWTSQKLNADYILWTASVSKDDDSASSNKVLGPQVAGKALTSEVPRWFGLSFRIDALPAQNGKPERHILYLGNNIDLSAGNAIGLGNTRTPLDAPTLPSSIEPASLTKAIEMIDSASEAAKVIVKKRLGL